MIARTWRGATRAADARVDHDVGVCSSGAEPSSTVAPPASAEISR